MRATNKRDKPLSFAVCDAHHLSTISGAHHKKDRKNLVLLSCFTSFLVFLRSKKTKKEVKQLRSTDCVFQTLFLVVLLCKKKVAQGLSRFEKSSMRTLAAHKVSGFFHQKETALTFFSSKKYKR